MLSVTPAVSVAAQVVSHAVNGYGISVNVPANTASSGSGPIFMQISAPSGTQWVSFAQGNRMAGANMFVVYARDSTNVTVSPRSAVAHNMPTYNSNTQITVLEGSGIASDGTMVANIRCDDCVGSIMSATSSSTSWIYGYKTGSALNTADVSTSIKQHSAYGSFSLDLTRGTGGSSSNPFVQQAVSSSAASTGSSSGSAATTSTVAPTSSQSAAGSATGSVSNPLASSNSEGSSSSGAETLTEGESSNLPRAHGIVMSVVFLGLLPLGALTVYIQRTKKIKYIHAPIQAVSTILLIVGLALGVKLGQNIKLVDGSHQIIGYVTVALLVLVQPVLGVFQHRLYTKTSQTSIVGIMHRWLGRTLMILGIINGGLGWKLAGATNAYAPYGVVAAIVVLIYIGVLLWAWRRDRVRSPLDSEKLRSSPPSTYEMQSHSPTRPHERI